jgi:DNA-binding transcriptional ArsR family regulator
MDADQVLSALGDGTRRALIGILAQSPASVSDLANALGVTKTAVGQHVAILEVCQLVSSEKTGRVRMCKIDTRGLDVLQRWIDAHRGSWNARLVRLGEVIAEGGGGGET